MTTMELEPVVAPAAPGQRFETTAWGAAVLALFGAVSFARPRAMWPMGAVETEARPMSGLPAGFEGHATIFDEEEGKRASGSASAPNSGSASISDSASASTSESASRPALSIDPDLAAALAVERARPVAPAIERGALLARPPVRAVALSPDGGAVAWLQQERTGTDLWKASTEDDGAPSRLLRQIDATELAWSHDGRWMFLTNAQRVVVLAMAGQAGSGVLTRLGGLEERRFVGVDPSHPAAVWIRQDGVGWRRVGPGVDEELVREGRPVLDVTVDPGGAPLLARVAAVDHQIILRLGDGAELMQCSLATRCSLLPRSDGEVAWLRSDLDGDLLRLRELPLHGALSLSGDRTSLPAPPSTPPTELEAIALAPQDGRPLITKIGAELVAVEPAMAAPLAALRRELPRGELSIEVGAARWLVRQRVSTLRGERFYVFDPLRGLARPLQLGPPWPAPDEATLAPKLPVRWQASDGRWLFGYLSVPPGRDLAGVPLIVKPHGGPWSATDASYDAATQLLANRGCAVFEPNFRGSTGYGRDYLLAAGSDFGDGRVQRDIVEGARAMLAAGIGDPRKVAAFGSSFGGYSALLAATHTPELFLTAIATAPPTDFGHTLAEATAGASDPWHDSGVSLAATLAALGIDPADPVQRARLRRESPEGSAAQLIRPVLLLAGGRDDRVSLRSVIHYAATLAALGKDVSLFVDAEASHTLDDPLLREAVLYLVEHMLYRFVATPAPALPSAELAALLRTRLRLVGPALQRER